MQSMKSCRSYVLGLYRALFVDGARKFMNSSKEFDRDLSRLSSYVEHHGLRFILIDMISLAKHFEQCLAEGRLTRSGILGFRGFKRRSPIPRLFKGLWLRVFDESGMLRADPDVEAIKFLRQALRMCQKLELPFTDDALRSEVNDFIEVDNAIVSPSLSWGTDCLGHDPAVHHHLADVRSDRRSLSGYSRRWESCDHAVQWAADRITTTLGWFEPVDWRPRHGPGAVSDIKGKSVWKYEFAQWSDRLDTVFPYADFAFSSFGTWADTCLHEMQSSSFTKHDELYSQLIAVPKTMKGPRLIAAEPSSVQWCQQVIRDYLMNRVRETWISGSIKFEDQDFNGSRALLSSHSGEYATVDLSAASDRVSCWLVERIFRKNPPLLTAFNAVRTTRMKQDYDKKHPKFIELRKFSTMGSALTFPVQSLVFMSIALGAVLYKRQLPPTAKSLRTAAKEVRVFGDDIIVPVDVVHELFDTLAAYGLKVNSSKSFWTGKFRESCGTDAYDGVNVTPTYVRKVPSKSKPGSVVSSVDTHNNARKSGLKSVSAFIRKTVESLGRYTFPEIRSDSGSLGWHEEDMFIDNSLLRSRWNSALHRTEIKVHRLIAKHQRLPVERNSTLLQYFTEAAHARELRREERLGVCTSRPTLKLQRGWEPLT